MGGGVAYGFLCKMGVAYGGGGGGGGGREAIVESACKV